MLTAKNDSSRLKNYFLTWRYIELLGKEEKNLSKKGSKLSASDASATWDMSPFSTHSFQVASFVISATFNLNLSDTNIKLYYDTSFEAFAERF